MKKSIFFKILLLVTLILSCSRAYSLDDDQLSCLLEPSKEIAIASQVQGVVKRVNAERGEKVKKGQVLLTLETSLEMVMIDLAREKVEFAKRKSQRNEELIEKNILTAFEVDEILTEQKISELELRRAEVSLQQKIVYSPVNAVVVERLVSKGEYAGVEPLIQLAVLNPLHAQVVMKADNYGQVKKGMKVEVVPEDKDTVYLGKVKIVDQIIDAASGTFGVIIEIPNPKFELVAGLKCRVHYLEIQ